MIRKGRGRAAFLFCRGLGEDHLGVSDTLPGCGEQAPCRHGRIQEVVESLIDLKTEHRALAVAGDLREFVHHVQHALPARRREEDADVVDPQIVVNDPGGDDLAIGENFLDDDRLDALGALVGFEGEDAVANCKQRVRFDECALAVEREREFSGAYFCKRVESGAALRISRWLLKGTPALRAPISISIAMSDAM